jgi:hypothetical protein
MRNTLAVAALSLAALFGIAADVRGELAGPAPVIDT